MASSFFSTTTRSICRQRCFHNLSRRTWTGHEWQGPSRVHTRTFLSAIRKRILQGRGAKRPSLLQDDLFHPFSKSPFPAIRERGEAIQKLASCPVCLVEAAARKDLEPEHKDVHVGFECPDCGWPTHCSEKHWAEDKEHAKYCRRLRESNEDEHDLRSGRRMIEFEMPGPIGYEETISFANWDVFWYTRGFPSMDTDRARRHSSKVLTYPITIASVLHQNSGLTLSNQRVTPEGMRSLAALRTTLHMPPGSPETEEVGATKPSARIFVVGARAESSLPTYIWEQLSMLFPSATVHVHFIGPQVSLPNVQKPPPPSMSSTSSADFFTSTNPSTKVEADLSADSQAPSLESKEVSSELSETLVEVPQKSYVPNVYQPPTPAPITLQKRTRSSIDFYGEPSYTTPYTSQLTFTGIQSTYAAVHEHFAETYDPYTDCFFFFSPGFGFPSPSGEKMESGDPVLQVSSPSEWGDTLPLLLQTKCPIFVTGFSPVDVERDVRSLSTAPGVAGQFEWVITPGENAFGSEKWEVADFDPRVMVKPNWGIWGIKGKSRDIRTTE